MVDILDGGMGGELIRRSLAPRGELWSAQALIDDPSAVRAVHGDFIRAGADVITTNSYATIPSYLGKLGWADRFEELTALAGRLARQAADASARPVRVAGSLPPLGESYRPDLAPPDSEAAPVYDALARALNPWVDVFLCETLSCIRESVTAVRAAREQAGPERPVWISWSLSEIPGTGLRSGESIADAVRALAPYDVDAFLFNCTTPEAITVGLDTLARLTDRPFGAYPNRLSIPSGWTLDNEVPTGLRNDLDEAAFVRYALDWTQRGASLIGGCCGVGPEYIRALRNALDDPAILKPEESSP